MPYFEPSRPMPDSLTPPNGATSVEMMPGVDADDAVFERLGDPPDAADVARVEIRGEAELGVVGHADRLVLGLEAEQRRHRAEGLLARDHHVGRDVRRARSARRRCRRARGACRRARPWRPCRSASAMCSSTFSTAFVVDQRALVASRPSMPSPTFSLRTASASFAANAS